MARTREVIVIGAGPAGISAAVESARGGAAVTVISETPPGGRATHASMVPSKALLHFVSRRRLTRESAPPDVAAMMAEIEHQVATRAGLLARRLEDAGVHLIRGLARFSSPGEVLVARDDGREQRLSADAIIVASGSVPSFPEGFFGAGASMPDGEHIMAPRFLRKLRSLPASILVIGAGVTGAEMVYAWNALGVEVTWLVDELGLLPRFDRELASSLGDVLMERGVKIVHGKRVEHVVPQPGEGVLAKLDGGRTYAAQRAFVAVGRKADLARLSLGAAGLSLDPRTGALAIDADARTSVPHIFAVGDAAGAPFTSSKAELEGWIAGRRATLREAPPIDRAAMIEAIYTEPEVARVGTTLAGVGTRSVEVRTGSFDESIRGALEGCGRDAHARGMLRIVADDDGTILGATAIGPHAAEVLAPIAVAIRTKATLDTLASVGLASPTMSEIAAPTLR